MQEIIKNRNTRDVVTINECKFFDSKIYVYWQSGIRVLVRFGNRYYWTDLKLSDTSGYGGTGGYSTVEEATKGYLEFANENGEKRVYIFDSQCELRTWLETRILDTPDLGW